MNNQHILFYSERCPHCEKFYNLLQITRKLSLFRLVCVDKLQRVPKGITSVPTIIIPGYNTPLVGDNVFNWLESQRQPQFQRQSQNQ